jgi:uncharacterized protein with GYD domain
MPRYLIQAQYTQDGFHKIAEEGEQRRVSVLGGLIRNFGGAVEAFYYALGEVDAYIIINLPDNVNASAFSIAANASGIVKVRTTVLLTQEEMEQATQRAKEYKT